VIKVSQTLARKIQQRQSQEPILDDKGNNITSVIIAAIKHKVDQLSKLAHQEPVEARYIRELFGEADGDHSGSVDMVEAMTISTKLNLGKPREVVEQAVRQFIQALSYLSHSVCVVYFISVLSFLDQFFLCVFFYPNPSIYL
jgi:hypothetical protein